MQRATLLVNSSPSNDSPYLPNRGVDVAVYACNSRRVLLFKPVHVTPILNGTKIQTRRLWERSRVRVGKVHQARTEMFGAPFAHLLIEAVRNEKLSSITDKDVKREGYEDRAGFIKAFHRINRTDSDVDPMVWVVDFSLASSGPTPP